MDMELFETVFNKASIYDMLFFNVKAVLEYPTLVVLKEKNMPLYLDWNNIAEIQYITDRMYVDEDRENDYLERIYNTHAVKHFEYVKIIAISYAKIFSEDGKLKRDFNKIVHDNEFVVIESFMKILNEISTEAVVSNPPVFNLLCGHNVVSFDIPLLIKRFLLYRNEFQKKELPLILKRSLSSKPWDCGIIDTVNIWRFGGNTYPNIGLIANYLGLKKSVELFSTNELNDYYHENFLTDKDKTLEFVSLQSATQTNLVIQLINELRQI